MEPKWTFDAVADVYDAARHGYPATLFDDLFRLFPPDPHVVEVGPGTGQATADLLARGARVHAVELGPSMAAGLRRKFSGDRLDVTLGEFEHVALAPGSFDAVFAATAYHWVDAAAQLDRPCELLRRGGHVAVVDTVQVTAPEDDGFFVAAQPIYERYGEGHRGPPAPPRDGVDPPMRARLAGDQRFTTVELRTYDWDQTYTTSEYRALMTSYSSTQMLAPAARRGLLDDIADLVDDRFGGSLTRTLVIALTTARFDGEP